MLQQTQVATVIPYYRRFMARFPDVRALWRLHRWMKCCTCGRDLAITRGRGTCTAPRSRIRDEYAGEFPRGFAQVEALPGIGRSTAGAILALSHGERFAILDGNVRRVLARYFGVAVPQRERATLKRLWAAAGRCTPHTQLAEYTQAIMDLGATVCLRRAPLCESAPCTGLRRTANPAPARACRRRAAAPARPTRHAVMVVAV